MDTPAQKVTRLISQACSQYPGGLRAVFKTIQEMEGTKKSEPTFYADFNPNESSNGKLKVVDFLHATQITGDYSALRYMAAYFGFSLVPINAVKPDAPTIEAEMLQDYPALVEFHKAIQAFQCHDADYETVLARMENALLDIRQTAAMAGRGRAR